MSTLPGKQGAHGEPYLRLQGVCKRFGSFEALKGIDLEIPKGEFVCFLGPSGCGKTSLLRAIAGLEAVSEGRLWQAGAEITTLPPARRDYGIVFQSYALFPNLSVNDNVAYGLVNQRRARADVQRRVDELLALVGLPGSGARFPAQLSGGQQQRIALARALATSPGLLLLDEPLSALDAIVRVHLRQEIKALQRQLGVTTIMVTHDQEEALSVADRIVVMRQGAIEQVGTPQQIYSEPATPFVADFVGRVNALHARREADGGLRIGATRFVGNGLAGTGPAGEQITVYLRPEDVQAGAGLGAGTGTGTAESNVFEARIRHIEFLGAYCLVTVAGEALAEQQVSVVLSPRHLHERQLAVGSALLLQLPAERLRVFSPESARVSPVLLGSSAGSVVAARPGSRL